MPEFCNLSKKKESFLFKTYDKKKTLQTQKSTVVNNWDCSLSFCCSELGVDQVEMPSPCQARSPHFPITAKQLAFLLVSTRLSSLNLNSLWSSGNLPSVNTSSTQPSRNKGLKRNLGGSEATISRMFQKPREMAFLKKDTGMRGRTAYHKPLVKTERDGTLK